MTKTLWIVGMVSNMAGRKPFATEDSYIKHVNKCIGYALKEKLSEEREQRLKHQRNDLIKNKEGEN